MGILDIINNSPYRVLFYMLIPYFLVIIIFQLRTPQEHFVDLSQKQESSADIKQMKQKLDIMGKTKQSEEVNRRASKYIPVAGSPEDLNYKRNMAEQNRIKKQIQEIDKKRKQVFLTEYQEATKTELELEKLHKEINELKEKLKTCSKNKEIAKEKEITSDDSSESSQETKSNDNNKELESIKKPISGESKQLVSKEVPKTVVGCEKDSDCNIFYGDGKNTCKSNKQCRCEVGAGVLCQFGPTNYKDPKDMTEKEKTIFKNLSNYDNFTIQDYKNWLKMYKKDYYLLSDEHLINLRKILRGEPIQLRDIPTGGLRPPLTSQKYFAEMYDKLGDLEQIVSPINSSTTGTQVGYNYSDYSDFSPPTALPQLRVVNGELERKYRRPSAANKIFPVPLEDSIGPYQSNPAM